MCFTIYLFTNIELVNVLISAYRAINYLWNVEKNRLIDAKKEGYSPKKMSISSLYIKISVKTFFICISLGYTKEKETERGVDRKSGHSDLISLLTTTTTFAVTQSCLRGNRGTSYRICDTFCEVRPIYHPICDRTFMHRWLRICGTYHMLIPLVIEVCACARLQVFN